ncbi:class I SAM-dependent methyltransferase [Phocicoccus pinnipedialis]|uniref:Putative methyltransferase YcgJ n=1 Tax=Phocicoccus pinnipedialis TaxID=110845 RepID=A0A6V7R8T2_9BACL|nr:class I SAM-dependent methyltransferase [Jeotgalicoccus pinnipedialis]MBP1940173.1 2-polyprenyl-3-methyl-5-hydroxy-6-metoxy-1,4-benzoquinol methylase [Jeotgalicoccus pinnipedialis]CAD2073849.1 putative methyltransferase YcgJ [Jeotgalicoccus pinnipedialis]
MDNLHKFEYEFYENRNDIPDEFLEELKIRGVDLKGKKVLDLGAGPGFLSAMMADEGAIVDAVEPSETFIKLGEEYTEGKNVTFIQGVAETIPLKEKKYDIVIALRAWQYFDSGKAIKEVVRLLKPNGFLVISDIGFRVNNKMMKETMKIIKESAKGEKLDPAGSKKYSIQMINGFPVEWFSELKFEKFDLRELFKKDYRLKFTDEAWTKRIETSSWLSRHSDKRKQEVVEHLTEMLKDIDKDKKHKVPHVLSTMILKNKNKEK